MKRSLLGHSPRLVVALLAGALVACGLPGTVTPVRPASAGPHGQAFPAIADPMIGPHAIEEARHAATAPLLPPATGTIEPRAMGPIRLTAYTSTPSTPFHREVFGFAPYWSLSHYGEWNYRLLSTVAYFGITIEANGYFNTTVSGWNEWNSQDLVSMINDAHAAGDRVVVVVKQFNHTTLNDLVTNASATQVAINNIIGAIQSKNLDGVNIDFEGDSAGFPNAQSGLVSFMTQLSSQVHAKMPSAEVSIDTYSGAASWDQGFFNIGQLAPVVDAMFIMSYDMGLDNNPGYANPNAPICASAQKCSVAFTDCTGLTPPCYVFNDTTSITEYMTKAPASKIILGVPYYGYKYSTIGNSWDSAVQPQLPSATADTYSNIVLNELRCGMQQQQTHWDPIAQSPWVAWYSPPSGDPCGENLWTWRQLYYDNPQSLGLKYDLVNQNNLRGAGMWALGYDTGTQDLWNEIAAKLTTTTPWDTQGGALAGDPAVVSAATGQLDAFVRGADSALWHRHFDGTTWQPWESLGGVIRGTSLGAASAAAGQISVFVEGQDNALWRRTWNGSAWGAWQSLGGVITSGPSVASQGPNQFDVFARGQDSAVWHRVFDGTTWQPWTYVGGFITSDPAAASRSAGQVDIVVRGKDNALWHRLWNGSSWLPWESLGGVVDTNPAAASCGNGKLDLFLVGQDGALWRNGWNGTGWTKWTSMGGQWTSGPGATCEPSTTTMDVFERGLDQALWHTAVTAT